MPVGRIRAMRLFEDHPWVFAVFLAITVGIWALVWVLR